MNRLPHIENQESVSHAIQVADLPAALAEQAPLALQAPHRLFFPQHFEARYAYPLLIWLHSPDSSEYELDELMPAVSLRNYVAVGLRGPRVSSQGPRRFCWSLQDECLAISEELTLEAARLAVEDLGINAARVFIGGYGVGGSVAQWVALRYPQYFGGAISINGPAPDRPKLLVRWRQAKRVPVLFMYGQKSTGCSFEAVSDAIMLAYRGKLDYRFTQFNCGDELDTAMTQQIDHFIMGLNV